MTWIDQSSVKRLAGEPCERGGKNAKLYAVEDVEAILTADDDSPEMEAAKLRRARADADKAELTVAKMRGELVNRLEVIQEVQDIFSGLYQKICIQYPQRNAGRLAKLSSQELAKTIKRDMMAVFDEIADEANLTSGNTSGNTSGDTDN